MAEPLVLMVAPLAPHIAEELWSRLGHAQSLAYEPFPEFDEALAAEKSVTMPVQVNGKRRFQIEVAADADEEEIREQLTGAAGLCPSHGRDDGPAHRHRARPDREYRGRADQPRRG